MIIPRQKDAELLRDIRSFKSHLAFKIWWLGQSGFLLKWRNSHILFDPYLSDSLSVKYMHTDKPHVRMSERAIDPSSLSFVDIVTSSHNHTDHLDADTLIPLLKNGEATFIIPEANRAFVSERIHCLNDFPIGLDAGKTVDLKEFKITGVPAAHNEIERNDRGECKYMGFIVQFDRFSVYHSGDTLWFEGLEEILMPYELDIAFLPINGNKPERKVAGNLNPHEAALLGKTAGVKIIIPHHYDLFEFNTENPALFVEACNLQQTGYKVLEIGEGFVYPSE